MKQVEKELLLRIRCGDHEAFEQLCALLESPVRRFIRRLIGAHYAEDDIVQDVFIALYRHSHRIEPVENLRPYLFRMVRNACYDELHRQGRFEPLDKEEDELRITFTSETGIDSQPEESAHWLLLYLEVREAMQRLPELQRQTLILYAEEELTYEQIAVAMNTNIGTVKSRLHHTKKLLRQLLKPDILRLLEVDHEGQYV